MKTYVLEDSSFLVATMDINDPFHKDAIFIFREILKRKKDIKIIIPPLAVYETITTLIKKGVESSIVENKIWKLIHIDGIITISLLELTAFKHCKRLIKPGQSGGLRTADFLLTSTAIDFDALILTFDKGISRKIKSEYPFIYFCSTLDDSKDESLKFLEELDSRIC